MKLWEVKAQSLRLMFADTDIEFNEEDFSSGRIYENANTREKLIRMNDSIKRAIDLFYLYNGELVRMETLSLLFEDEKYKNILDTNSIDDFGEPTRVDINPNISSGIFKRENISFNFDRISKKIYFTDDDFSGFEDEITFTIYFQLEEKNIDDDANEMTYDLDTLYIPPKIQRQIPNLVKAELYQEDEPSLAKEAERKYIEFLILNQRKNNTKNPRKVKSVFPRGSE